MVIAAFDLRSKAVRTSSYDELRGLANFKQTPHRIEMIR